MKHLIQIVETRDQFECSDSETVLDGMNKLGRRGIPSGCRGGACGVCKVEVLSGVYVTKPMSSCHVDEEDLAQGRVLACRILPASDLELRVIGKMKARLGQLAQNESVIPSL